jgi:enediyne polyketide synthase
MSAGIAIVGMACVYPDARNPHELWENVLARRRAFRRIPAERLSLADYFSSDPAATDTIHSQQAALIEGYEFDRLQFRVAGPVFRSVDLVHWLALDVADQALKDAALSGAAGIPRETSGVLVGNTLTGEFSRAATLRLRWPYVRRTVEARLLSEGWTQQRRLLFLDRLEEDYKAPFEPGNEETLAGALSNTIAGRICNHFHLRGGGYTVDGACCSSLLAVARAASALEAGELDLALAGGVDLSLDPFELVGFSRVGALARSEMLVYDRESSGFIPGEGCGFVVLMRTDEALARGLRAYAIIRGWGISSDGAGSITRPEMSGQLLALQRAYRRAGYGVESVGFFEGHGTGTTVGDQVELQTLAETRRTTSIPAAAVGSVKANLGHTKAAAGVAGLIKAALAVYHRTLPPTTGVHHPRPELEGGLLRALDDAEPWPKNLPVRAGINSFGFGGINVHVTIENSNARAAGLPDPERFRCAGGRDAELFIWSAPSPAGLAKKIDRISTVASALSYSELKDCAAALAKSDGSEPCRTALVAASPLELVERLDILRNLLNRGATREIDSDSGIFLGLYSPAPRIGFLFPGQASPIRLHGGVQAQCCRPVREVYESAHIPHDADVSTTDVAQLAIVTAELAGIALLQALGITASLAIGHSLGEIAAYCWAGALDEAATLRLAEHRGRCMSDLPVADGAMASISATAQETKKLIDARDSVVIACYNGPRQIVIAGEKEGVRRVVARAQSSGLNATLLATAHAFHSPLMYPAAERFHEVLGNLPAMQLRRRVISTVTGAELPPEVDLPEVMVKQLTAPVRFEEAVRACHDQADLWLEVGPGHVLTSMVQSVLDFPVIALDIAGPSVKSVFQSAAAAYVLGAPVQVGTLFKQHFVRPFDLERKKQFFSNPCESAPVSADSVPKPAPAEKASTELPAAQTASPPSERSAMEVIRSLLASRMEMPVEKISEESLLLRDFHLNSIVVAEIVAKAARQLGVMPPRQPLDFADASVRQLTQVFDELRQTASGTMMETDLVPAGVRCWQRAFVREWASRPPRRRARRSASASGQWQLFCLDRYSMDRLGSARLPGFGVVVMLPDSQAENHASMLLEGAHAALRLQEAERYFVILGPGASVAAAFARTLHLESPEVLTCVIETPPAADLEECIPLLRDELESVSTYSEARYEAAGERFEPYYKVLSDTQEDRVPIECDDVLLVSGGGRGIVARCVAALARATGARVAILGRSDPQANPESVETLAELSASGVRARYFQADVSSPDAVRLAVQQAEMTMGRVVAIVHGAGANEPRLLRQLDEATMLRTLAPKVSGLKNLLAAVDTSQLRLLCAFGSVIGRIGLRGEAHYALANARLSSLTEEFSAQHRGCRCVVFESSAWSGIGMAERMRSAEGLRREGIEPITPEQGVEWFKKLLNQRSPAVSVVVAGRLGATPSLPIEAPPLPLIRFVERPRVHYPGIELVVESDLSTALDPYLLDHVFEGNPIFPGVMALEAMVQTGMALTGEHRMPILEAVRFERPLVVEPGTRVTLRIAALLREDGVVEVVARSSQTFFAVDHFFCTCRFVDSQTEASSGMDAPTPNLLEVDVERDLYGKLLFQTGRFRRLAGYRHLSARSSWAEISGGSRPNWFAPYLPEALVLGDPAARDAAIHSVQACVPHAVLLPVGVKRVIVGKLNGEEKLLAYAIERRQEGNIYWYDVELRTLDGVVRELWEGLMLQKVGDAGIHSWPDSLAAASLEWRSRELTGATELRVALERDPGADRRSRSERAIQKVLGTGTVSWRSDGKPEAGKMSVSSAHMDSLTLAVAGPQTVACDLEPVSTRPARMWVDLLGLDKWRLAKMIAEQMGEDLQSAATRVWTAIESLKKAGAPLHAHLSLDASSLKSNVILVMADLKVVTSIIRFRQNQAPVAVSILTRSEKCAATNIATASVLKRRTS